MQNEHIDNVTIKAIEEYSNTIAPNEIIEEGNFNTNVDTIVDYIKDYIAVTNERPTIVIDYLQILAPSNPKLTDKQQIDYNVTTLKKISRDYNIPIIVISSFNRNSYYEGGGFEAFKESGGIEYTADVMFDLQLSVIKVYSRLTESERKKFNIKEQIDYAKQENPRKIVLTCLKNRNGKTNFNISFDFNPVFNAFREQPDNMQELN